MQNLLEETERVLSDNNKTWDNVVFISTLRGSSFKEKDKIEINKIEINKETFIRAAKNIEYNSGFGRHEINLSLKIVGDGWWLERHEYDGSERWVYKEKPKRPKTKLNEAKALLLDKDLGILGGDF